VTLGKAGNSVKDIIRLSLAGEKNIPPQFKSLMIWTDNCRKRKIPRQTVTSFNPRRVDPRRHATKPLNYSPAAP
jgi:hypothetical protein